MHDKQTKFLMRETTLYYFRLGKFDALCAKPDRLLGAGALSVKGGL